LRAAQLSVYERLFQNRDPRRIEAIVLTLAADASHVLHPKLTATRHPAKGRRGQKAVP